MYVRVSHFLVCEIKGGVKFRLIAEPEAARQLPESVDLYAQCPSRL